MPQNAMTSPDTVAAAAPSFALFDAAPKAESSPGVQLTQRLMQFLTSGAFTPNQRLPGERALAEQLGVGRTVIRESIRSLVLLGLLEVRQGDGTYLRGGTSELLPRVIDWGLLLGDHTIDALVEARSHIEVDLAALAARKGDTEAISRIKQWYWFMEVAAEEGDVPRFVNADTEFHLAVAAAADNSVLAGVLSSIRSLLRIWTERVVKYQVTLADSLAVHEPILHAIEAHDEEAARQAMAVHMEQAVANLRRTLTDTADAPTITPPAPDTD